MSLQQWPSYMSARTEPYSIKENRYLGSICTRHRPEQSRYHWPQLPYLDAQLKMCTGTLAMYVSSKVPLCADVSLRAPILKKPVTQLYKKNYQLGKKELSKF